VSAAITAARAAIATSVADEPDDPTEALAAGPAPRSEESLPRAGAQLTAAPAPTGPAPGPPAGRRLPGRITVFRGAARSLFVTPWFAAATGFVIAAGLWVSSPHTVLRFPNSEPGVSLCKSAGCVQDPDPEGGSLAVVSPGVKINDDSKATARHATKADADHANNAAHGLTFKFTVLWQRQNGFGAEITVSGHKVPSSWRLSFELPGAQIANVAGVTWHANVAGGGGIASAPSWRTGGDPGDGGYGSDGGGDGLQGGPGAGRARPDAGPVISFLITASGPQTRPAHCVFDHAACSFR
jgi:hypothetical protein